ncbi:hypothetical protein [Clostridium chauvoei]|uniref:Uncharacterized protein n=1 Tax=Clostridium chauvoei TaxID=46867 RepID=A0ABD4RF07_9CLOT|nr:hypothetical protein [Clostridium chauvoei]ATD55203.1 hypothetical protein BTM20_08100 [Clostridium chauvoei]ATD57125.1 hypothetical protein BTM21_04945 [Clostridium chauvoei]MBX7279547.1 hypothetical protein [Clostridium chauvoei]MBX7281916.1 hypothetical protein [Clostridium chauvoei]MBX7284495.1 hypothetical protein [Clostridium chauvoei]
MKGFIKNKDFIPKNFSKKREEKLTKEDNKGILLLILINIFILPMTISSIFLKEEPEIIEEKSEIEEISSENIKTFIDEIDDNLLSIKIKDGIGEILVKGKEKIFSLEENRNILIDNIKKLEDNKFLLSIKGNIDE